jgi:hypothetical protein
MVRMLARTVSAALLPFAFVVAGSAQSKPAPSSGQAASLPATSPADPRLQHFLEDNHRYQRAIEQLLLDYEGTLITECNHLELSQKVQTVILSPVSFNAKGVPWSGSWKQTVEGSACGDPRTYNIYAVLKDGQLLGSYMMPGSSAADFALQKQTIEDLGVFFRAYYEKNPKERSRATDCDVEVLNTTLLGGASTAAAKPNTVKDTWQEIWRVRLCTRDYDVTVNYQPDATTGGTAIGIPVDKLVSR